MCCIFLEEYVCLCIRLFVREEWERVYVDKVRRSPVVTALSFPTIVGTEYKEVCNIFECVLLYDVRISCKHTQHI